MVPNQVISHPHEASNYVVPLHYPQIMSQVSSPSPCPYHPDLPVTWQGCRLEKLANRLGLSESMPETSANRPDWLENMQVTLASRPEKWVNMPEKSANMLDL
mmetsp:Transcript_12432/g.36629  ORF Transcript_12432/g.36629 Transcript_12432/m.36629 type:complete len:102 (+) Transcript_12432:211-516(+)